jgi:hypothetical protein
MNWMYSGDSLSHSVYARTGLAADAALARRRGEGWADCFALRYAALDCAPSSGARTLASPP